MLVPEEELKRGSAGMAGSGSHRDWLCGGRALTGLDAGWSVLCYPTSRSHPSLSWAVLWACTVFR